MTGERGNVWMSPPPPIAVLSAMNLVAKPLLSSAFGKRMRGVMLLEFNGRRSGKPIRVPVNYHQVDGVPMAFTDRPWRLNFEGGTPVKVTYLGQVRETTGTLISMTPEQMGIAVRKSLDTGASAQRMGIRTVKGFEPTAADLATLGTALGSSVITFDFVP
jgi:hypothetical protein